MGAGNQIQVFCSLSRIPSLPFKSFLMSFNCLLIPLITLKRKLSISLLHLECNGSWSIPSFMKASWFFSFGNFTITCLLIVFLVFPGDSWDPKICSFMPFICLGSLCILNVLQSFFQIWFSCTLAPSRCSKPCQPFMLRILSLPEFMSSAVSYQSLQCYWHILCFPRVVISIRLFV